MMLTEQTLSNIYLPNRNHFLTVQHSTIPPCLVSSFSTGYYLTNVVCSSVSVTIPLSGAWLRHIVRPSPYHHLQFILCILVSRLINCCGYLSVLPCLRSMRLTITNHTEVFSSLQLSSLFYEAGFSSSWLAWTDRLTKACHEQQRIGNCPR